MFKPVFYEQNEENAIDLLAVWIEDNLDSELDSGLNWNPLNLRLDTKLMLRNCQPFAEELAKYVFNPIRLQHMAQSYGYDLDDYVEYFM